MSNHYSFYHGGNRYSDLDDVYYLHLIIEEYRLLIEI